MLDMRACIKIIREKFIMGCFLKCFVALIIKQYRQIFDYLIRHDHY